MRMPTCEGAYALYVAAAAYERGPPLSALAVELSYACMHCLVSIRQRMHAYGLAVSSGLEGLLVYIYICCSQRSLSASQFTKSADRPFFLEGSSFLGSRRGACRAEKRRAEVELSGISVGFGEREREPFSFRSIEKYLVCLEGYFSKPRHSRL